jgi:hypothetical protein
MKNNEILNRLNIAFPQMYINDRQEAIIHPRENVYFRLKDCETEEDVIKKILHWLSRPASKSESIALRRYLKSGINSFLSENFTLEDLARIYNDLGNGVDKPLTQKFINEGYNMKLLRELPKHIKPYYQGE